jgi:hypothetical protein
VTALLSKTLFLSSASSIEAIVCMTFCPVESRSSSVLSPTAFQIGSSFSTAAFPESERKSSFFRRSDSSSCTLSRPLRSIAPYIWLAAACDIPSVSAMSLTLNPSFLDSTKATRNQLSLNSTP